MYIYSYKLYVYFAYMSWCLSVCLYPINVKTDRAKNV